MQCRLPIRCCLRPCECAVFSTRASCRARRSVVLNVPTGGHVTSPGQTSDNGGAGCRHLRAAHSPCPRTVRLLMQQAVQQQAAVPVAACAACRCNHPGHDGHRCGADVRRREFRPAASGAESDNRSNPDFMWRIGPTYLGVRAGGGLAKSWSQRLRINGKPCNLGLGRYPIVTLAEARDKALENARTSRRRVPRRAILRDGCCCSSCTRAYQPVPHWKKSSGSSNRLRIAAKCPRRTTAPSLCQVSG